MTFKQFVSDRIDNIKDLDKGAFASATGLGPWIVPMAPAIVFGWAFYDATKGQMKEWSIFGGIVVSLGLIIAGALSSHTAIMLQSYNVSSYKKAFGWSLVGAYITLEIGGLWAMSLGSPLEVVGTVIALLTLNVYLARSLAATLAEEKETVIQKNAHIREDELKQKEFDFEMERLKADREHAQKLARIEANKEKAIAKITVQGTVQSSVQSVFSDTAKNAPNSQKTHILNAFENNPSTPIVHLAEQLNCSRNTIYKRIHELIEDNELARNGVGYKVQS